MITEKIDITNELKGKTIFLSTSLPSADRDQKYYINTNPLDITNAVIAFVENILIRNGNIVFGGHPTISPLVLTVANKYISIQNDKEKTNKIYIYQSKRFENQISNYTVQLLRIGIGKIIWTEEINNDRDKSLSNIRVKMLKDKSINAGLFIGGMKGIEMEFKLFLEYYPNRPFYLIGSSGGATKILAENYLKSEKDWDFPWEYNIANLKNELYKSKMYTSLAKLVMKDISSR